MASKLQVVNELHRGARKNFERRKTLMAGINDTYQIDLVEMIPYAKQNQNYKYILTVIDIFSKYAWAFPLKSKKSGDVFEAMSELFAAGHVPKNIHSDLGKEFYNSEFQRLMKRYEINHYSTFSSMKAAIVERFNRTLKTNMWKQIHLRGSYKWIDILSTLLKEYNDTKHSTIKMKPKDVNARDEKKLMNSVYKYKTYLKKSTKFHVGDHVRISKYKHVFEKGYTPNWTTEIFSISSVHHTQPVTYLLKDYQNNEIKGSFYEPELQKVKHSDIYLVEKILKRRGDEVYVKWLGFDNTHNSWISKDNIE